MYYCIRGRDAAGSLPLRKANRAPHLDRLRALAAAGKLLIAGPLPAVDSADPGDAGFIGSVVIAEFESLSAARAWADADPYLVAGAWASADVDPFVKVLP